MRQEAHTRWRALVDLALLNSEYLYKTPQCFHQRVVIWWGVRAFCQKTSDNPRRSDSASFFSFIWDWKGSVMGTTAHFAPLTASQPATKIRTNVEMLKILGSSLPGDSLANASRLQLWPTGRAGTLTPHPDLSLTYPWVIRSGHLLLVLENRTQIGASLFLPFFSARLTRRHLHELVPLVAERL